MVRFDRNHLPSWDGNAFQISSVKAFSKELKQTYRSKYKVKFKLVKIKKMNVKLVKGKKENAQMIGGFIAVAMGGMVTFGSVLAGELIGSTVNLVFGPGALIVGLLMMKFNIDPVAVIANAGILTAEIIIDTPLIVTENLINIVSFPFRGLGNALVNGTSQHTQFITSQNGWNWVESPKRLSHRKFSRIKAVLGEMDH